MLLTSSKLTGFCAAPTPNYLWMLKGRHLVAICKNLVLLMASQDMGILGDGKVDVDMNVCDSARLGMGECMLLVPSQITGFAFNIYQGKCSYFSSLIILLIMFTSFWIVFLNLTSICVIVYPDCLRRCPGDTGCVMKSMKSGLSSELTLKHGYQSQRPGDQASTAG